MNNTQIQSVIFRLQSQLQNKKQEFNETIKSEKEFALAKPIYLEIKKLEGNLKILMETSNGQLH